MTHVTPQRLLPKRSSGESKFFCTLCAWCFSPAHASVQCKNGAKFATVQHGVWYMIPCDHDHREHWCKDLQHLQLIQHSFQFPSPDARSFAIQEKKTKPALNHWPGRIAALCKSWSYVFSPTQRVQYVSIEQLLQDSPEFKPISTNSSNQSYKCQPCVTVVLSRVTMITPNVVSSKMFGAQPGGCKCSCTAKNIKKPWKAEARTYLSWSTKVMQWKPPCQLIHLGNGFTTVLTRTRIQNPMKSQSRDIIMLRKQSNSEENNHNLLIPNQQDHTKSNYTTSKTF